MEDTDLMLSECPSCKFQQDFDMMEYIRNNQCIICNKCHKPYTIISGIVYGRELSIEEYKEWKFIQKLRESN